MLAIVREVQPCRIRAATPADQPGAYRVCLETGDDGGNATALYAADPDALGRIYVGPYLAFEPELSLVLEDDDGICGYALGALDSRAFLRSLRTRVAARGCVAQFPEPAGDPPRWTRCRAGPPHLPSSRLFLPGALRALSVAPAHRPAARARRAGATAAG